MGAHNVITQWGNPFLFLKFWGITRSGNQFIEY